MIVVQHVQPRGLCRHGDREVGSEADGGHHANPPPPALASPRAQPVGQRDRRRSPACPRASDRRRRFAPGWAHRRSTRSAPASTRRVATLSSGQQQLPRTGNPACEHPRRGVDEDRALAMPQLDAHALRGGRLSRSISARSRSNPSLSIAANSASIASRRPRPACNSISAPSTASLRTSDASGSRVPVTARTRASRVAQLRVGRNGDSWVLARHRTHSVARGSYSDGAKTAATPLCGRGRELAMSIPMTFRRRPSALKANVFVSSIV